MPKTILSTPAKLNHKLKVSPQYSPHKHTLIVYGRKEEQQIATTNQSKLLPKKKLKQSSQSLVVSSTMPGYWII